MVIIFIFMLSIFGPSLSLVAFISPLSTPQLPSQVTSATALSGLSNLVFYKHHDLILGSPTLESSSYMSTNIASTIWVQDQPFENWKSAWSWMYAIKWPRMRKKCAIDLVSQKIRIEDAFAKTSKQINELIKRDWQHLELDKSEKKSMRDRLSDYIKAGKKNEKRQTNYLT